jgi:hypothetical protein
MSLTWLFEPFRHEFMHRALFGCACKQSEHNLSKKVCATGPGSASPVVSITRAFASVEKAG